jgi:5-methylcytosine-specific restriction enzyme A
MPTRLCKNPRCPDPATYRGRCQRHAKQREKQTHPNKHIYNTKRWQILRRRVLFDQPLCACGAIATDVDHILAIEDGGQPWAIANLQPMCRACHATKTNTEVRAR